MQSNLKIIAGRIVAAMGVFWIWGQSLLDQTLTPTMFILPVGALLLCWLSWLVRSRRRRASGWGASIDSKLVRARTIGVAGLLPFCFVCALAMDRLGDRPHQTFVLATLAAAWVAVGIVSLLFCAVCFVGGGKP